MVRTALKAVANRFAAKPAEAKVTRRIILVIRLVDGDWVLQKKKSQHQPRHRYTDEAKSLFRGLFSPKIQKETFCAKTKADAALHEALGFRRPSDIVAGAHFERGGIEYHPVMLHLDYYSLGSDFIKSHAKVDDESFFPVEQHEYAEKLKKRFPR